MSIFTTDTDDIRRFGIALRRSWKPNVPDPPVTAFSQEFSVFVRGARAWTQSLEYLEAIMHFRVISFMVLLIAPIPCFSADAQITKHLSAALLCKGDPAQAVYSLVDAGSNFKKGYAAYGFGEGTSYKAIVVLDAPLRMGGAVATAVISETENSNPDFGAFTYARFKGDYRKMVALLKLQPEKSGSAFSFGKYVSRQQPPHGCPPTIMLTPIEDVAGEFLLGCGWCNG